MPCDPSRIARLSAMLDEFLANRPIDDDDDDEDFLVPLDAPKPFNDGEHGGVPQAIHVEPKKDLFR